MPSLTTLAVFSVATFALVVTPGAGIVYVVTQTIDRGRSAGIASMLGIEAADLAHMVLAVLGVSALLAASELTYNAVRYAGAAYLIGIGIYKLLERPRPPEEPAPSLRRHRVFAQGFLVQILNPKPALFFAAFLPQFIDPDSPIAPQLAVLGLIYVVIAMTSDFAYVLLAGIFGTRLKDSGRSRIVARISGVTYIALGVLAALAGARPAKAVA